MTIPLLAHDSHDSALLANLRPAGYANPIPKARYQLVVVGGGPGGLVAAAGAAGLGASVALVERDLLGGDCLNVGCVPSKTLIRAGKAAAEIRHAARFGIRASEPQIDFSEVMQRVRRVRAELSPNDSLERFAKLGIDVFLGEGKFLDASSLEVAGAKLNFNRCIIATGARAHVPEIPGLDASRWFTNETIFTLTELPRRLLVIGAGPIGCELGQAFARLGSCVTIVAETGQLLPREHEDARAILLAVFQSEGIAVVPQLPPFADFDAVLVAAGRVPNVERLNLTNAGVAYDEKTGIAVDRKLRTTNPHILAVGDVCSQGQKFTHAADAMARVAVQNAFFPRHAILPAIPRCTYTDPEIGSIDTLDIRVPTQRFRVDFQQLDRAATDGANGFLEVIVENGTDRIVGATAVGPHAGELIGTLSLAVQNRLGLRSIAGTVLPYPTYAEAIKKIADQYSRSRLTPTNRWLLRTWLRWMR